MSINQLYDLARKELPRSIHGKRKLFNEMRVSKYRGDLDSQFGIVVKEFMMDIDYAIKNQISKRMLIFTIISAIAGLVSIFSMLKL